jgi:hypothetical protein
VHCGNNDKCITAVLGENEVPYIPPGNQILIPFLGHAANFRPNILKTFFFHKIDFVAAPFHMFNDRQQIFRATFRYL